MNLPGRLRETTLGDLLGQLHRERVSGILELLEAGGGGSHRVYFAGGLVDDVQTSLPAPRLGEVLSAAGALSRDGVLQLARRLTFDPRRRSGEILVEERLADERTVTQGLRRQLALRLEALFRLREALVRFHVRPPRAFDGTRPPALEPSEFLHDRPRARQRARGDRATYDAQQTRAFATLGLAPGASRASVLKAFRRLAREHHPDRRPDATPAQRGELLRRFSELSAAYHTLVR